MTVDADTHVHKNLTAADVRERFDGEDFTAAMPESDHWECDQCSTGIEYRQNVRAGMYMTDDVLGQSPELARIHRERPLIPLATLCPDCSTRQLLFPCEGFAELRLQFDLGLDRVMQNVEITDVSPRDDGIPWDPRELSEKITGVPFDTNTMLAGGESAWGPEDMVRFFLAVGAGVDIRELVKWDGSLDPKVLGRARKEYDSFASKMRRSGFSRKSFRDHVRGDDR